MARTFTINLADGYYAAYATGKTHLMNARHAERIITARNSKPEFTGNLDSGDDLDAHFNSTAYKQYERAYRLAMAEARVVCIQRQTRVYATPTGERLTSETLPSDLCAKCASHL